MHSISFLPLVGSLLLSQAVALPTQGMDAVSGQVETEQLDSLLYYKGMHFDNGTGHYFDLYVMDDSMTPDQAFANYWSVVSEEDLQSPAVQKRDWKDCTNLSAIQTAGCGTAHGLGKAVQYLGTGTLGYYFKKLIDESFNGSRDNQSPRSVCMSNSDNYTICVSWSTYATGVTSSTQDSSMSNFAANTCAPHNYSAEFKLTLNNGKTEYICTSNRADGCGSHVC